MCISAISVWSLVIIKVSRTNALIELGFYNHNTAFRPLSEIALSTLVSIIVISIIEFIVICFSLICYVISIACYGIPEDRKECHEEKPPRVIPRGTPSELVFRLGALGSILTAFMLPIFALFIAVVEPIILNPLSAILFMGGVLGLFLESVGMYGFYRNYGKIIGAVAAVAGAFMSFILSLLFAVVLIQRTDFVSILSVSFLIMMFIVVNLWAIVMFMIREYMPKPEIPLSTAFLLTFMGFLTIAPILFMAYVFKKAPTRFVYE